MSACLADAPRVCPHCEADIDEGSRYCETCGNPTMKVVADD